MRGLRRIFRRFANRLGPLIFTTITVGVVGVALHASLDWHHHGGLGAGSFHLHVHVGEHHHHAEHADAGHHHQVGGGRETHPADHHGPDPSTPEDRQDSQVITLASGIAPAPPVATAALPLGDVGRRLRPAGHGIEPHRNVVLSAAPRGPPA